MIFVLRCLRIYLQFISRFCIKKATDTSEIVSPEENIKSLKLNKLIPILINFLFYVSHVLSFHFKLLFFDDCVVEPGIYSVKILRNQTYFYR